MGIDNDLEIVQLVCGNNTQNRRLFAINVEECAALDVFTVQQAREYIGARVKRIVRNSSAARSQHRRTNAEECMEAMATIIIAHVPVDHLGFRTKAIYLAIMARRVLQAMQDEHMVDDRDYVGNKRLELCVQVAIVRILSLC
jgi:DNA-directed RNA polymerase III subunit RPC2